MHYERGAYFSRSLSILCVCVCVCVLGRSGTFFPCVCCCTAPSITDATPTHRRKVSRVVGAAALLLRHVKLFNILTAWVKTVRRPRRLLSGLPRYCRMNAIHKNVLTPPRSLFHRSTPSHSTLYRADTYQRQSYRHDRIRSGMTVPRRILRNETGRWSIGWHSPERRSCRLSYKAANRFGIMIFFHTHNIRQNADPMQT